MERQPDRCGAGPLPRDCRRPVPPPPVPTPSIGKLAPSWHLNGPPPARWRTWLAAGGARSTGQPSNAVHGLPGRFRSRGRQCVRDQSDNALSIIAWRRSAAVSAPASRSRRAPAAVAVVTAPQKSQAPAAADWPAGGPSTHAPRRAGPAKDSQSEIKSV
jgi:hypothetical protein